MITLYGFPMSCSLAVHISLLASGETFDINWVSLPSARLADGSDYAQINPRRQVPSIAIDGEILTETPAILQFIADKTPRSALAPTNGTLARAQLQSALNYFASEVHKQVLWQFSNIDKFPGPEPEYRKILMQLLCARLDFLTDQLGHKQFYLGDTFSLADAYMVVILYWAERHGAIIKDWPSLCEYRARLHTLPVVKAAVAVDMAEQQRIITGGGRA